MGKVAIVTGGNKGIGYETVRGLIKSKQFETVYLTARNENLGKDAVKILRHPGEINHRQQNCLFRMKFSSFLGRS